MRRSAKLSSSCRGASDSKSIALAVAVITVVRSSEGCDRISASIKQKYSVSGAAAIVPCQQAWHLPVQPSARGGLCNSEMKGKDSASVAMIAAVSSDDPSSIAKTEYRSLG